MSDVLCYSQGPVDRAKVGRAYRKQRSEPERCDNPDCYFHTGPLIWNGEALPLTLDHIDGNKQNNLPSNLRLLCPNCDSQLPTRGGKNIGRIRNATADSYMVVNKGATDEVKVFLTGEQATAATGTVVVKPSEP